MLTIILSFALGLLSIADAFRVDNPILAAINWVLAVAFIASGSISGWQYARNYKN